jgi:hypothetical protein
VFKTEEKVLEDYVTFLLNKFVCVCVILGFELRASCLTRQVLYHLSAFYFSYFSDRILFSCPGLVSVFIPPT